MNRTAMALAALTVAAGVALATLLATSTATATSAPPRIEPVLVDTAAMLQCDTPETVGGSNTRVGPATDNRDPQAIVADWARAGLMGQGRAVAASIRAGRVVHDSADRRDLAYSDNGKIVAVYTFTRHDKEPLALDSWALCAS